MPFSESIKLAVKEKSNFQCCICEKHYVEIHHIIPQEEDGPDTEENAAPLCPTCHDTYGANPQKRKYIREKRDYWYSVCKNKYSFNSLIEDISKKLQKLVTTDDLILLEDKLKSNTKIQDAAKPKQIQHYPSNEINNFIKQKKYLDALKTINKNLEEFFYLKGTVHGELNQIEEMINAFNTALGISKYYSKKIDEYKSYHWAKYFNSGVNQFKLGTNSTNDDSSKMHYNRAIHAYKKAIMIKPDSGETFKNLAFVYLTMGRNEESIEPLKKLIDLDKAEEGYEYLGQVYYALGANLLISYKNTNNVDDKNQAYEYLNISINTLEEGLNIYHNNTNMRVAIISAYIEADKVDVALNYSQILIEKDPFNKTYRYNYGVLLLNVEKYSESELQFKKALEMDPNYENAIYNLGITYVKWGTAMNKETEKQGIISENYKQKYKASLPYLEKVVEKDSSNIAIWELLGKVYSVLGMTNDAINAFNNSDKLRNNK